MSNTYTVTMDDGNSYDVEMDDSPQTAPQTSKFVNPSIGDSAAKVGQGALETAYAPFQAVGEAIRGAGEGEPLKVATAQDSSGFRAPSILQRLIPSLQTPQPPADPFQKAYQGLEGIANLPRGLQKASDVVTGQPDIAAQLGGLGLALGTGDAGNIPATATGKVIGKIADAVLPDSSIAGGVGERLAAKSASGAFDLNPMKITKQALKEGVSPEQYTVDLTNKANELIPNLIEVKDTPNTKITKILNAHDEAGNAIGNMVDKVSEKAGQSLPEGQQTIDALRAASKNYYEVDGGEQALTKTADRLEALQKDGKLDFDRLSQVKSAIGKGFGKANVPPGTTETYDVLNNGIDQAIQRVSTNNPKLGPAFDNAKQVYTVTSRLLPAMAKAAGKEVGGSMGGGVMDKVLPSIVGGALGGIPGAIAGGAAKYAQDAVAPDLWKNLTYLAMKKAPQAGQVIKGASAVTTPAALASTYAMFNNNNPNLQANIQDLIGKLKAKYDAKRRF
jgi:hypothetical protein